MRKNNKAFTLVELIVVITILSILGIIAFISMQGYSSDARDSVRLSDIKNIETGLELFTIKSGFYPQPDNGFSYSGSNGVLFTQGEFGDNLTRIISINKTPLDPKTNQKYIYSSTKDGSYYNVSTIKENSTAEILPINGAYADNETSILKGNYRMDPTLPSLIVVPSSVTGSGIFDPNVCFIVDGGRNTVDNCVEKKSEMSLKNYESNLVAYYDMETYYQTTYNSIPNVVFLKDLSGNNYDMYGEKENSGFLDSNNVNSLDLFSSGGVNYNYVTTGKIGFYSIQSSTGNIIAPDKNLFVKNVTGSGGEIIPGISAKIVLYYNKDDGNNLSSRILNIAKVNTLDIDLGDYQKDTGLTILDLKYDELNSFIRNYSQGPVNEKSIYGSYGCGTDPNFAQNRCNEDAPFSKNPYNGQMILNIIFNFRDKKAYTYGNGKLILTNNLSDDEIKRTQENGYKNTQFRILPANGNSNMIGKIYEVAIYDRALSKNEVLQQAKIAGF